MKKQDLKNKDVGELKKLLVKNQEKLRELRFDLAAGKLKNIKEVARARKEIARILTIINLKLRT